MDIEGIDEIFRDSSKFNTTIDVIKLALEDIPKKEIMRKEVLKLLKTPFEILNSLKEKYPTSKYILNKYTNFQEEVKTYLSTKEHNALFTQD